MLSSALPRRSPDGTRHTHSHVSISHIALLRGVNLGGKNLLPMKELTAMFSTAGCNNVRNYIQSGNIIFDATPDLAARLSALIEQQIAKQFNLRTPVILRTARELARVARSNPFIKQGSPEELLHVVFLADLPSAAALKTLDPDRSPPDAFIARGREIYLRLPNGAGRTRLSIAWFDSRLKTIGTQRNWRTVLKLRELTEVR